MTELIDSTKTLREILATDSDLRRRAQRAGIQAWYKVITDAGYSITSADTEETKADLTALSIAISDGGVKDDVGDTAIKVGIAVAIASGGF